MKRHRISALLVITVGLALPTRAQVTAESHTNVPDNATQPDRPQEEASQPATAAVSRTGLLPVYGVDFGVGAAWVDGARFPSESAEHPNFGVNTKFQKVWDTLKPGGFNVLRLPVNVNEPQQAANRVANLCVWARNNNVKLVIVLIDAGSRGSAGDDFAQSVEAFIKNLLSLLCGGEAPQLDAYAQILAYQIENEMNHAGRHRGMRPEAAQRLLVAAAETLRRTERDSLKDKGLAPTALMVNASFDYELIKAHAMAGATWSEEAYTQAYDALKHFLSPLAASPNIDIISVDWYAGSLSAGGVDKFPTFVRALTTDLAGKKIVFGTGFSSAFRTAEEQQRLYALTFANLADYRASEGVDCPFVGLFFREAENARNPNPKPPTPDLAAEVAQWDRSVKAEELTQMWNGKLKSAALTWWLMKVNNNMGLASLQETDNGATASAQPPLQGLQQIADAISKASETAATAAEAPATTAEAPATAAETPVVAATDTAVPPEQGTEATPPAETANATVGSQLKDKVQQGLMGLLDQALAQVGNLLGGSPGSSAGEATAGSPADTGNTGSTATYSITLEPNDVTVTPGNPRVGSPSAFAVNLHNQSADAAAPDLIVAVYGPDNTALGQAYGISVAPSSTQSVRIDWTPTEPSASYDVSVMVADANGSQIASTSLNPLSIAAPNSAPASGTETGGTQTGGTDSGGAAGGTNTITGPPKLKLPIGLLGFLDAGAWKKRFTEGQPSSINFPMLNPYARPISITKATLLVDGKVVENKTVGMMQPKQSRSLVFSNLTFSKPGKHEITLLLESGGTKPLKGSVTSQVLVESKAATPGAVSGGARPVRGGLQPKPVAGRGPSLPIGGAGSTLPPRSILPPSYDVGRITVPSAPTAGVNPIFPAPAGRPKPVSSPAIIPARPITRSPNPVTATQPGKKLVAPVVSVPSTGKTSGVSGPTNAPSKSASLPVAPTSPSRVIVPAKPLTPSSGGINSSRTVKQMDLATLHRAMGTRRGQKGYLPEADLNHDGVIDQKDESLLKTKLGGKP